MWNDTVTLYIDDTSIRLLVCRGRRVRKWADLQLEPGLVKGSVVVDQAQVASKIKQLFKSQKVKAKKVILGFSGLHSLTRPAALPQLPKSMLPEAVAREARRILPVPLDQLYLSWRSVPCPKGRIQIFMAATPRKTADSLMETLREAGLKPCRMAIKPLALTKAVPVNTAMLVDIQPTEFDIVIMSDGIAQPIRTVTFPNEELNWEQKLAMITSDVDRTIKFFDTNNPEKPLDSKIPVFISGELMGKPELSQALADSIGHPVKDLSPAIKGPKLIDMGRYMVNIAMAINWAPPEREDTFPAANLNVMPAPYQSKPISLTKFIAIPSGVAVAGLIVAMVMLMQNDATKILAMQTELDATNQVVNQRIAQQQELKKNVAELEKEAAVAKTISDKLALSLDTIAISQEMVQGDLDVTLGKAPNSATLASISETAGNVTVSGRASLEADVINYARDLDLSKRFSSTTISSLTIVPPSNGGSGSVEFTINLERK
jgi:type IV pilus assembly protein PilM